MRSVYVRERSRYDVDALAEKLGFADDKLHADDCISYLLRRGVIGTGAINDDEEEDTGIIEYADYYFKWVGLAIYGQLIIIVYPKYFPDDCTPTAEQMSRILGSIWKVGKHDSEIGVANENSARNADPLARVMALFDLYSEYGEYTNYVRNLELNGSGTISWERTIAQCQPVNVHGTPVYFDVRTVETTRNNGDYVTRLHRCLLTMYSRQLHEAGLDTLLALTPVELSDESLEDFGDDAYIAYRLEQELNTQFVTWKRVLIRLMLSIISDADFEGQRNQMACLGTTSYAHVWEAMCKQVFDDKLGCPLDSLDLDLSGKWRRLSDCTLQGIIPRPQWFKTLKDGEVKCGKVSTLIPDVVSITDAPASASGKCLCIYDAKYYTPTLGQSVKGAPGVESITKQFLYQAAYKTLVEDQGFTQVFNIFLVPTSKGDKPTHMGRVQFPEIFPSQGKPFSNDIDMWALPADWLCRCYLNGETTEKNVLEHILETSSKIEQEKRDLVTRLEILTQMHIDSLLNVTELDAATLSIICSATGLSWARTGKTILRLNANELITHFQSDIADYFHNSLSDIDDGIRAAVLSWNRGDYQLAADEFSRLDLRISLNFEVQAAS